MGVASGYANSGMSIATYTITSAAGPVDVSLESRPMCMRSSIKALRSPPEAWILEFRLFRVLTGTSVTWSRSTFALAAALTPSGVGNATVPLPTGNFTTLNMLATGVNDKQPNQTFVVAYADGTSTVIQQSLSDWFTPQNYAGEEANALTMA